VWDGWPQAVRVRGAHSPKSAANGAASIVGVLGVKKLNVWASPRNTLVQLFCLFSSGLIGSRYEYEKEPESAEERWLSELEPSMSSVQIEQKSYEMPPKEGISIAHFLTVADVERSARYYEKVFGARILTMGDGNAPPYLQLANIWMILNVGGGPTPDKPTVTLSVPDPNHINSFMNFRVADIQACYELWKSRGAEFITEPIPKYGEIRCYIRDPDGYIIEVGQSTDLTYG
jgi:catechol 2,3-dioxygenase-like lactoylglutathione lyase family enzyme